MLTERIKNFEPGPAGPSRPLAAKQKLALIAFTGTRVNEDGRIVDDKGLPVLGASPPHTQYHRTPFDEKDNRTLTGWLARAAVEGISLKGPRFFKDLERTVCGVRCRAGTLTHPSLLDLPSHLAVLAEILETRLPREHAKPWSDDDCTGSPTVPQADRKQQSSVIQPSRRRVRR